MDKFDDKFMPLTTDDSVYRTIAKQLRKQDVNLKENWVKDIKAMSVYNTADEKIVVLMFYNSRTKEFFSTYSVCHSIDKFNLDIGLKICASRMAKHTDFVNSITAPLVSPVDYLVCLTQGTFKLDF